MADQVYKGIISETFEREWKDKNTGEDILLYSFKLNSENKFFRTGTNKVPGSKGDAVKFTADGRGNVDLKTWEEIEADEAPAPKARSKGSGGGGGSRNDYWEKKAERDVEITEPRISYSAAQRNATTLVAAALEADILSFGQAAKGKKLDMLVDFVEQTTLRLAQLQLDAPNILKEVE